MFAAKKGHPECVKLLIEKEAGLQDNDGWTALMKAMRYNKLECVRLLAEREKEMKTTRGCWGYYPPGTTALRIAKKEGYKEIVSILKK